MFSRIIQIASLLVLLSVITLTCAAFFINHWLHQPLNFEKGTTLTIQSGDTVAKISQSLSSDNVLKYPRLFTLYSRLTDRTQIKVGEYAIPENTTPENLLALLESGKVISHSVLLLEGKTYKDFLAALAAKDNIEVTLKDLSQQEQLALINPDLKHPEGWFFPNTYAYTRGESDLDILRRSHDIMQKILEEQWQARAEGLPYKNKYEALIMASIIEKETGVAYERAEIAGVFVRRLQKGMRLQTDPTIIYGLGDDYKGNIRRKHLRQKTPYNTYMIDGLPPTPIAMPGREAIHAALHPKEGETLFFVAKGDGSHYFSKTLSEHNRAVRKYQIEKRREDYRSSPSNN